MEHDLFKSLDAEALKNVELPSHEEIEEAIERGRKDAAEFLKISRMCVRGPLSPVRV